MAKTKIFSTITEATWECIRTTITSEYGTKYESQDGVKGTSTTPTAVGSIVLEFSFDKAKEMATYTIRKKPLIILDKQIWDIVQGVVERCLSPRQ